MIDGSRPAAEVLVCARVFIRNQLDNSCPYVQRNCEVMGTPLCEPYAPFRDCPSFKVKATSDIMDGEFDHLKPLMDKLGIRY
jgi:hypothetical protein